MAVITISRQYGSGGDEIATRLWNVLGYRYFDKRLMAQVATEAGLSPTEVVDSSEDNYEARSLLERLFGRYNSRGVIQTDPGPEIPLLRRSKFSPRPWASSHMSFPTDWNSKK